jgi:Reverse transcriptase (RNA-dependent DNA polymerase)
MRTLRLGCVLHCKFKHGTFKKNKGRIVARGNYQHPGSELILPVMCLESPHTILALAATRDLNVI